GLAHVVGVGLEGEAEHGDDRAVEDGQRLLDHGHEVRAPVAVHLHGGPEEGEVVAEGGGRVDEGGGVLGEAAAPVAQPRGPGGWRRGAARKAGRMRASRPTPFITWVTSAPACSHRLAMALANEILVARKALDAYLIISAEGTSVMIMGRSRGAYSSSRVMATCWVGAPITIRSGRRVSSMAEPSRRNSGLETTSNGTGVIWLCSMTSRTRSPVPTGTVDLLTMTV